LGVLGKGIFNFGGGEGVFFFFYWMRKQGRIKTRVLIFSGSPFQ